MLKSNLGDFRSAVLSGDITKTTGGKINSKVVTAAIDTNTGDIYYGISGMNNNPTRNMTNPQMQEILNSVNGSMTNYCKWYTKFHRKRQLIFHSFQLNIIP